MSKSINEFAIEYAQRIKRNSNKIDRANEVQVVLNEINKLTYENSNPITSSDKITLLKELEIELKKPLIVDGKMLILSEADNKNYLDLISTVLIALQKQNSAK